MTNPAPQRRGFLLDRGSKVSSDKRLPSLPPLFLCAMICVADSGSTKTDWVVLDGQHEHRFETVGLNPFFHTEKDVSDAILPMATALGAGAIKAVYFYGAGCSSEERNAIVAGGLQNVFTHAHIEVEHDLLGSTRAVCGSNPGIACILGTGSNSCYFDGKKITDNVPSLGYILGDEGGGVDIGRRFVKALIYREMPDHLAKEFAHSFQLSKEEVLKRMYHMPLPNRWLASLAPFASEHRDELFVKQVLHDAFHEFISRHVMKYEAASRSEIGFVGSIAYTYATELKLVLNEHGLRAGKIIRKPIESLVNYHRHAI